jgi:Calcineurin-like phosphoesterase
MAADKPDFMIDLGDNFFVDRERPATQPHVVSRVQLLRSYYDLINHSVPLFLALGNHEGEWGRNLNGTANNVAVYDTLARKNYFPNPEPNNFYSGSTKNEEFVGLRQSNYAWEWGDALFIVLDPYWNRPKPPEMAGEWQTTLGKEQYDWLRKTLETSHAKYKFLFSHNLIGGLDMKGLMRGGIETVKYTEMGGYNYDGSWGWDKARPGWYKPIHQLLVENNATIYFHGHDHLYAKQDLDGIVYQEGPVPARSGRFDATQSAKDYNYTHGTVLGGSGYIRVRVSPEDVKVDYVQTYLPSEEDATHKDGTIADSYTMKARKLNPAAETN